MQETKAKSSQFGDMALESTQTGFIQKLLKECRQKVKQEKDTIQSCSDTNYSEKECRVLPAGVEAMTIRTLRWQHQK